MCLKANCIIQRSQHLNAMNSCNDHDEITLRQVSWQQACVACGGSLALQLSRVVDAITREEYEVFRCENCGLGVTVPQPSDLRPYYSGYHGGRHGVTTNFRTSRRLSLLTHVIRRTDGMALLDVGCGDGTFLLAAREAGWMVAGTEMNPELARRAGLDVYASVGESAQHGPFDVVTLWHSLEHMREPRETLCQIRDVIGSKGVVLIAVPNNGGWQARVFGRSWLHLDVPRHLYHFDRRSLTTALQGASFTPIRWWYQELEYDIVGWSQSALNSVQGVPNVFLGQMMGRAAQTGRGQNVVNFVAGIALSAASLPLVLVAAAAQQGGTLVVAARAI